MPDKDTNEQELQYDVKALAMKLGAGTLLIVAYLIASGFGVLPKFASTDAFGIFVATIYGAIFGLDRANYAQNKAVVKALSAPKDGP